MATTADQLVEHVQHYVDIGFHEVHLHNVGRNQAEFIDLVGREVIPNLKLDNAASRERPEPIGVA
jgi:hypothetical protein